MNYKQVVVKKIPYYFFSLLQSIRFLSNPWEILKLFQKKPITLRFRNGLKLTVSQPIDILIVKETIIDDSYRLKALGECRNIIDVGAAFGDFSLFASHIHPEAKIIAFEPNPESFSLLKENIKLNKANTITLYNQAIGKQGKIKLYIPRDNVQGTTVKISARKIVDVVSVPLSDYIGSVVDFLKIDTEGAELEVLASIKKAQFTKIKRIICEYHNHLVEHQDEKITQFLMSEGFKTAQIKDEYFPLIGYISAWR